jgi:predicted O-linked N-acetylglucosamine transferase (SPINDLY family)
LPVVALRGRAFAARVSSSILEAAGLAELIVDSLTDYEALVYRLAAEPQLLRALRARIEGEVRDSPLFDTAAYCRHLELAYRTMWTRSQRRLAPDDIAIARDTPV